MSTGGVRPGSGRPKGALQKRSVEIARQAALTGTTPLEVMLDNMRHYLDCGEREKAGIAAKDAAPYMHPRLTTVAVGGDPNAPPVQTKTTLIYSGVLAKGDETV